jgi:hypothetical protein
MLMPLIYVIFDIFASLRCFDTLPLPAAMPPCFLLLIADMPCHFRRFRVCRSDFRLMILTPC